MKSVVEVRIDGGVTVTPGGVILVRLVTHPSLSGLRPVQPGALSDLIAGGRER